MVFDTPNELLSTWELGIIKSVYLSNAKGWLLIVYTMTDTYKPPSSTTISPSRRYRTIVLLIIESGAVIAAAKIVEFVLFKTAPLATFGNHTLYIVFDMMPQITVRLLLSLSS